MRSADVKRYLTIINNIRLALDDMVNNLPIEKNDVREAEGFLTILEKDIINNWLDDYNND